MQGRPFSYKAGIQRDPGRHFDKVDASGDTGMKSIDFRNKKYHIINYTY